jgi:hypothetical protein
MKTQSPIKYDSFDDPLRETEGIEETSEDVAFSSRFQLKQ